MAYISSEFEDSRKFKITPEMGKRKNKARTIDNKRIRLGKKIIIIKNYVFM